MKYFKRIRSDVPVQPLLESVFTVDEAWNLQTGRQEKVRVQREAQAIPLRGLRKSCQLGRARRDVHESRWTTGSKQFPVLCHMLQSIAEDLDADLGRAKLVLLPAGRRVYPHIDRGRYYQLHDRYHLVLRSSQGSWLRAGDEEVRMQEGELWWFDNRQIHEAHNDGSEDRIHLIFDLLSPAKRAIAREQFLVAQRAAERASSRELPPAAAAPLSSGEPAARALTALSA
ncbi:MAG: aspartyl/asparaginyl beta-hydroxylase domain-containing protein [Halieaceae bacterium]|jgi:aspartyl/asparaginyl beta-hydroxylase (cupin superfamily)|nr:aspartyl/asparaginyl beta-hydroxylase domain-containing protein [Halieaceae bacterium]